MTVEIIEVIKFTAWDGSIHYTDDASRSNIKLIGLQAKQRYLESGNPVKQMFEVKWLKLPRLVYERLKESTPTSEWFD